MPGGVSVPGGRVTWGEEADSPATGRLMAPPGDIGDLPQEGAIEGGLLHEPQALLQLVQGLVLLGQRLLQLHYLWRSPFSQGHQAWLGDGSIWRQTCQKCAFLTVSPSGMCTCLCTCCTSFLEFHCLPYPLARSYSPIRSLAHRALPLGSVQPLP